MKTWINKNMETIKYALVILCIVWLICMVLAFSVGLYKALFKVDPNDGVVTTLEKVSGVANALLDLVVPLSLILVGILLLPFLTGAATIVAITLIVVGLIGVVGTVFGWWNSPDSGDLSDSKNR